MNELNRSNAKDVESSSLKEEQMRDVKNGDSKDLVVRYSELYDSKVQLQNGEFDEYKKFAESGVLDFDINRYLDSITYYCMPHDDESEKEYNQHCKPPFPITDLFKERVRLIMQTRPPTHSGNHDLYELREKGYDMIQAIKSGCEYWRDNASDESISSKAKYVVDTIDQCGYEMGSAGNYPSVVDDVIDVLEYAEKQVKEHRGVCEGNGCAMEGEGSDSSGDKSYAAPLIGAISGYALVDKILNHYGDEGIAKLLECTGHQETEYLELKTSYLLSEKDRKEGETQDNLTWNIALALIAIANTAGGALIIGIGNDNRTLYSVEVKEGKEAFLRMKICQVLLPYQRVWTVSKKNGKDKGGKAVYVKEKWRADRIPRFEARLCPYSDGINSGDVVLILVEPQPRGHYITLENTNQGIKLLVQRAKGQGHDVSCLDSAKFRALDNERHIESGRYLSLLHKMIPDVNATPIGRSSGVYRFKPIDATNGRDIEDPLVRQTEGHRLCSEFQSGDRIDKYIVKERIGSGGMGVVYRVRHESLDKEYALKAFKMESEDASMAKERFRTEAQVLKQLDHPGLPKVYDLGFDQESECLYLVQDLIIGGDGKPHELGGYVACAESASTKGLVRASGEEALKWLRQVCEIADYLHGKGIAHRDITLKNLLIDVDDNVKLTDFGVAKVMDPELRRMIDCQVTMTVTQTPSGDKGFWGTWRYLPPEVRNKRKEDIKPEATDVWAIGVCFFKLLTGEWFEGQQFEDYEWSSGKWGVLLKGMLKSDSKERLSCADVLGVLAQKDVSKTGNKSVSKTRYDKLVAAFRKALVPNSEGVLPIIAMLDSPLLNIESPTFGGKRWWDTLCEVEGWKLQKNKFFNQIRILDPQNFRRAWGWRRGMERMLDGCSSRSSWLRDKLAWLIICAVASAVLLSFGCYAIAVWMSADKVRIVDLGNGQRIRLVKCPSGMCTAGSPSEESGGPSNEVQHVVRITMPFWVGETEVTQGQWKELIGESIMDRRTSSLGEDDVWTEVCYKPGKKKCISISVAEYYKKSGHSDNVGEIDETRPVYFVSWNDACRFCETLTVREFQAGRLPEGYEYRLPTEDEWEYFARAGVESVYPKGKAFQKGGGANASLDQIGWCLENAGSLTEPFVHPCGSLAPNAWGIYDLAGNVSEWCLLSRESILDGDHETVDEEQETDGANSRVVALLSTCGTYASSRTSPLSDGLLPSLSAGIIASTIRAGSEWYGLRKSKEELLDDAVLCEAKKPIRGGAWNSPAKDCRIAARHGFFEKWGRNDIGFRVVLAPRLR